MDQKERQGESSVSLFLLSFLSSFVRSCTFALTAEAGVEKADLAKKVSHFMNNVRSEFKKTYRLYRRAQLR